LIINHLVCARFATNLTLFVFTLFILGVILSTVDLFLKWDILPDWIQNYAQLLIIIFGIIACLLVVSSLLCSLMVLAESAAKKAGIASQESQFNRRKTWIILIIVILSLFVAFFVGEQIDDYRENSRIAKNRIEFQNKLDKQSKALANSLSEVVTLFPENILQAIENKSVFEKPAKKKLVAFLDAVSASLPEEPEVALLIPTMPPYQYAKIWVSPDRYCSDKMEKQQFFTQFSNDVEKGIVEALFKGEVQSVKVSLKGHFIDNSEPSAWGILKFNDKIVALIFLSQSIDGYYNIRDEIFHLGTEKLISN
jgi:hypothetical protein